MRKVILCIPTLGIGGAEKFVVDLATKADKSAFDVIVAVTRVNFESYFKTLLQDKGIRVVDLSGKTYFHMLIKQVAFLKRERPDVVHTNIGSVLHMMLATKLVRTPVKLYTMHNQAELLFGTNLVKKLAYKLAFTVFGYTPVAICDNVRCSIINAFGIASDSIKKVNNGVDLEKFGAAKLHECGNTMQIINTGRMHTIKNQATIIGVFGKLYLKHPNLRLTILGDGELRPELEKMVVELGLSEVVDMPGNQMDVCSYLQKADIYVSASSTEGLPLSILEAMACGLPVVATDAGGTVDIIKNGENGIVVPKTDTAALERALEQMIMDERLRRRCGEESLNRVKEWSLAQCVRGYEDLYRAEKRALGE